MKLEKFRKIVSWGIYVLICLVCCVYIYNSSFSIFKTRTELFDATEPYELKSEEVITQKLNHYDGALKNLYIKFGTYARINRAELTVRLLRNEEAIYEWDIDTSELLDNAYKKLTLPHYYIMSSEDDYSFQITEKYENDNSIAVWLSSGGNKLAVSNEGILLDNRRLLY